MSARPEVREGRNDPPRGRRGFARSLLAELNGGIADLGVLLPFALGLVAAGLATPAAMLAGFGLAYLATAAIYRAPVPVQPMKALGALALAGSLDAAGLMLCGVLMGLCLVVLGASGAVRRIAYVLPQSVGAGLQLGLGGVLALHAISLMAPSPALALVALAALGATAASGRLPGVMVVIAASAMLGLLSGGPAEGWMPLGRAAPTPVPAGEAGAVVGGLLAQLPLTLVNAVIVTAALARELLPDRSARVSETRLCLTSGGLNLLLCPFGAVPMCHGAGGLAAHHRFGSRSGLGTAALGGAMLLLALVPSETALAWLALVPQPVLGALLLMAAAELALSRRVMDATMSCKFVIAAAAVTTFLLEPLSGIAVGIVAEVARRASVRWLLARRATRSAGR